MDFITLREYAENKGVSYEAIRKQVSKYEDELRDHIVKRGRVQYLDGYAQEFLAERRRLSPVVVKVEDSREDVEELKKTVESLRAQLLQAQNELLDAQRNIIKLQSEQAATLEAKVKYTALLEDNEAMKRRLDESEERAGAARADLERLRAESETREAEHRRELEEVTGQRDAAQKEAASFAKSWFGFYRKKKGGENSELI